MKIGIIFAMKEELDELKKLINIEKIEKIYELTFFYGIIDNKTCIFVESGIGKVNAARTTQILIDKIGVDYIFNIGVAGGISNDLQVGDIVIGEKIVQHDFDITAFNHKKGYIPNVGVYIESDKMLINIASNVITEGVKGVIATGDIFCSENNMAKKINDKFGALCVEMEGASIAQVCYLCNIPFIIIRSISDVPNNNNVVTYEEFLTTSAKKIAIAMRDILLKIK
ncbi:MAG: 5'-methylthioadenosine/adenosylhomocysteine nucleosidase [Bacilli bacterium]|nr:5'-methylthioadenosine/adenosylhomocysteine nucleosidase [Bacilli bacterium]